MKKSLVILLAAFLAAATSFGQKSDISNAKSWTWLGIDYTHCYFITSMDFIDADDLLSKTKAWNNLVYTEREKYIEKALEGKNVTFSADMIKDMNMEIDMESRITNDESLYKHLDPTQAEQIVSNYKIPDDLSGVGLVFIAESYSKPEEAGAYYVTFIDLSTKKVLSTERMTGKAKGFGLRNYWAYTFYKVLQEIGKKYE
ncbi:MAG: hypothetical protein C0591_12290 [Marinilabiliales bacterium]|nr:MAG: hypothetical protein C0591_12290 [Marinilabiliales bacterium]